MTKRGEIESRYKQKDQADKNHTELPSYSVCVCVQPIILSFPEEPDDEDEQTTTSLTHSLFYYTYLITPIHMSFLILKSQVNLLESNLVESSYLQVPFSPQLFFPVHTSHTSIHLISAYQSISRTDSCT